MDIIPKVDPTGEYKLSGATLNRLIDAANAWQNLSVQTVVSSAETTRIIRAPSGNVLRIVFPPAVASGGSFSYRELTHSITVADLLPTATEISTALVATYTDPTPDLVPADGDFVILTVDGEPKFVARITTHSLTASGEFVRSFVVNSVTYYATLSQCGLY